MTYKALHDLGCCMSVKCITSELTQISYCPHFSDEELEKLRYLIRSEGWRVIVSGTVYGGNQYTFPNPCHWAAHGNRVGKSTSSLSCFLYHFGCVLINDT